MEGTFPASRVRVWRLLRAHTDESTLHEIHPWIRARKVLREEGPVMAEGLTFHTIRVVERDMDVAGRTRETTWTYRIRPLEEYSYRIAIADGSAIHVENSYADAGGDTRIASRITFSVGTIPDFLQRLIVRRVLNRADREDLVYFRKANL